MGCSEGYNVMAVWGQGKDSLVVVRLLVIPEAWARAAEHKGQAP